MTDFSDIHFETQDGLRLHARDYTNPNARTTLLCLHGLTRNAADFEDLCDKLRSDYRLLVPDQRGRGLSDWDIDPANYNPGIYCTDTFSLLDHLGLDQVIAIGTSMGGLMSIMMAAAQPTRFRAIVLNDIGPELDPIGVERIKAYIGKTDPVADWDEAAARCKSVNGAAFPDYQDADWQRFARRTYSINFFGIPELAYDPAIATPFAATVTATVSLWPLFDALSSHPMLVIRGALSDLLAPSCVAEMQRRHPGLNYSEVPNRGHAPALDEPEAVQAIKDFLAAHS